MVEEIINASPKPVLPKIDREPIFEDIQVTTRLLNANTISISAMAVEGVHGHLGTILTQVEYYVISPKP
jgi:formylmethanofuran dehydrogenase subunit A